jgi:hypothetical protein
MADSKYIKLNDAVEHRVYSREFKDYVVPVKQLKQLETLDEPKEKGESESEYYENILRPLFNRCWAQLGSRFPISCLWCGLRSECEKRGIRGERNK